MVEAGDALENPVSGQHLIVRNAARDTGGELLEVEALYTKPTPSRPPVHYHSRQDEGNAYLRLGGVLTKLGREDEAREAYGAGIGQAEKFGHSGMAEDLRLAQVQLGG